MIQHMNNCLAIVDFPPGDRYFWGWRVLTTQSKACPSPWSTKKVSSLKPWRQIESGETIVVGFDTCSTISLISPKAKKVPVASANPVMVQGFFGGAQCLSGDNKPAIYSATKWLRSYYYRSHYNGQRCKRNKPGGTPSQGI
jgi:hypothetical protein